MCDDSIPTGLEINDAMLLKLAHYKSDGNILPLLTMTVAKHTLNGAEVAVVTVESADSPPIRYRGRILDPDRSTPVSRERPGRANPQ